MVHSLFRNKISNLFFQKFNYLFCLAFVLVGAVRQPDITLPRLQAQSLVELFISKNISFQFDVNLDSYTKSTLLRIDNYENEQTVEKLFEVSASTIHNTIKLTFLIKNASRNFYRAYTITAALNDGNFHKIILIFNRDVITVVENCRQIMKISDPTIDYSSINVENTDIYIANNPSIENGGFYGTIREFTTSIGNPLDRICGETLQLIIDNNVQVENDVDVQTVVLKKRKIGTPQNPELAQLIESKRSTGINELVDYVKNQMKHWSALYETFEQRIRKVELHQRGCHAIGRSLIFGQRLQNMVDCTECQCLSSGELQCGPIGCPKLECKHPKHVHGQCCPVCGLQCFYNGMHYENGDEFWPKQCVRCQCDNGRMDCQFRQMHPCPILNCEEQETPLNQCCPVCVNVDHCDDNRNPCHKNAHCETQRYSAKCTCKNKKFKGFFGNGTTCYDIDECQWDQNARDQLGGCQKGAVCINLPGSFKCECLPGFQKLDEQNCLDLIRI